MRRSSVLTERAPQGIWSKEGTTLETPWITSTRKRSRSNTLERTRRSVQAGAKTGLERTRHPVLGTNTERRTWHGVGTRDRDDSPRRSSRAPHGLPKDPGRYSTGKDSSEYDKYSTELSSFSLCSFFCTSAW